MKKIVYAVIVVVIAVAGFFAFWLMKEKNDPRILSEKKSSQQQNNAQQNDQTPKTQPEPESDLLNQAYADMNSKCENGEWINVDSAQGDKKTFTGRFSVDVPFEENVSAGQEATETYFLNGKTQVVSAKEELLSFFEGREVEISGVEQGGKINVEKIRCAGKETNKDVQGYRQEVMNYVAANLNKLSPEKGNWEIYDIAWPADDHIYVDFAAVEDDETENTDQNTYSLLLQVAKDGSGIKTTQVAFLKMGGDEEEEWSVISGTDKFKDLEDMDYYEYDDELKKWIK